MLFCLIRSLDESLNSLPVIMGGNSLSTHFSRRGKRKESQVLQLDQKVLFCNNKDKASYF